MKIPKSDKNINEQLALLRAWTAKYGGLHEAQVLQLKIWPRLCFPHALKTEARVDTEARRVEIELVEVTKKIPGKKRLGAQGQLLAEAVRRLLGDEWEVEVGGSGMAPILYEGVREIPQEKYVGTDFEAGKLVPRTPWKFIQTKPSNK